MRATRPSPSSRAARAPQLEACGVHPVPPSAPPPTGSAPVRSPRARSGNARSLQGRTSRASPGRHIGAAQDRAWPSAVGSRHESACAVERGARCSAPSADSRRGKGMGSAHRHSGARCNARWRRMGSAARRRTYRTAETALPRSPFNVIDPLAGRYASRRTSWMLWASVKNRRNFLA
jgi:hypothetical protein